MNDDEDPERSTLEEILVQAATFVAGLCFILGMVILMGWFG